MAVDTHLTRPARRKRATKPRRQVGSILPPTVRLADLVRIENERPACRDGTESRLAFHRPYPAALHDPERWSVADERDDERRRALVPPGELDMALAVESFGDADSACDVLSLLVRTARRELVETDRLRDVRDWKSLAGWVHRTQGALALFGAPGLLALGEAFERDVAFPLRAGPAFDAFRLALDVWLDAADAHLALSSPYRNH